MKEIPIKIKFTRPDTRQNIEYDINVSEEEIRCMNVMLSVWPNMLFNMVEDFIVAEDKRQTK